MWVAYLKRAVFDYIAWDDVYILEAGSEGLEMSGPFGVSHNRKDNRFGSSSLVDKQANISREANAALNHVEMYQLANVFEAYATGSTCYYVRGHVMKLE